MNPLDERFRSGLDGRRPEVPPGLWDRIAAAQPAVPDGDALDRHFADKLGHRRPVVPATLWPRIVAARAAAATTTNYRRYALAALALLLLLVAAVWTNRTGESTPVASEEHVSPTTLTPAPATGPVTDLSSAKPTAGSGTEAVPATRNGVAPLPQRPTRPSASPVRDRAVTSLADAAPPSAPSEAGSPVTAPAVAARSAVSIAPLATGPIARLRPSAVLPTVRANWRPRTTDRDPFRISRGNRLQTEILLGAGYANQTLRLRAESDRGLLTAREVSEFPEVSYQFSARIRYRAGRRLRLLTGLTYVELRNQFESERTVNGRVTLLRSNNHLRMLEMPLLVSYELPGRRLRLNVNAGPLVNLSTGARGRFLHPSSADPLDLRTEGNYRNNVGLGWTASLTTTYLVGRRKNVQLLVEPFFKSYTGSFTQPDAPLAEHYWLAGLQLGLRKQLR